MTPRQEYRIQVRQFIGEGQELFTDEDIDAVQDTFGIAWPQPRRVAQRLINFARGWRDEQ